MTHLEPRPLKQPFFTPGTFVLMTLMGLGISFGIARLFAGLEAVTNLDNNFPWGIWIAIDVACGVALAAGGFTTAALVDIFGGKKYHALLRPAVLTAWLGYIMVAIGLMFDLGRYWNIWQPIFHWQGNSVMFELAMCVMAYLIVLTFEIAPSILEGLKARIDSNEWGARFLKKFEKPIIIIHQRVKLILPVFILAGVVLSCMHQSSLGTIMVIAPTKLSALWYTPWLPLLFLLSAVMVGFPMVILESVTASKGFNRQAEMELLDPLAAKIPWIIGVYALFKFGSLFGQIERVDFLELPGATVSFAIEVVIGIIAPMILFSIKTVRKSVGWLLTACFLVIFGVALNRLNVFLVGYNPTYAESHYFPSIGEISLTIGLISALILLYRFFVNYFPILPAVAQDTPDYVEPDRTRTPAHVRPKTAWVFRGAAALFLISFVILYVVVHQQAIAESRLTYGEIHVTRTGSANNNESQSYSHLFRPENYRNYYIMNSPLLNSRSDYYEPVRFSHRSHDTFVNGNCVACHHRYSDDPEDRLGMDFKEMHKDIEIRIGGACSACHDDLADKEFSKCGVCHVYSNEADYPARIGLKGAYHRQCIGCHEQQPATANAPTDCKSCHHPLIPDHSELLKFASGTAVPTPQEITTKCLDCHRGVGDDILKSAHWNWKGVTPGIEGHEHDITVGLFNVIDNYTIAMCPSLVETQVFHIGYSPDCDNFDFQNPLNIDCFVCHDTTGTYRKVESMAGYPDRDVDLKTVSNKVGRPSRSNCGSCHFYSGGGANVKHGDLEPGMAEQGNKLDFHMGVADMRCQDCHTTSSHQIAGMSFVAPVTEGRVQCEKCHGESPHRISGILGSHLDDHVRAVSCETCHIPFIARETPTRIVTDFSTAGQDREIEMDMFGMPTYDKKWGDLTWGKNIVPQYRWFDGNRKTYLVGDPIDPSETVELNTPLGEKHIPQARIFPFKVHTAKQPYDTEKNILTAVKFKQGLWDHYDWNRAIQDGMAVVGKEYSGKYDFVETRMYTSIHHGTVPAKQALGCADCHRVEAISCKRCHKSAENMGQPYHTRMVYPEVKNRIDFKALGYDDDPALIGGRFYINMGRGLPPR